MDCVHLGSGQSPVSRDVISKSAPWQIVYDVPCARLRCCTTNMLYTQPRISDHSSLVCPLTANLESTRTYMSRGLYLLCAHVGHLATDLLV